MKNHISKCTGKILSVLFTGVMVFSGPGTHAQARGMGLIGWGVGSKPAELLPKAAQTGFTGMVAWKIDTNHLASLAKAALPHGIEVYCSVTPGNTKAFKKMFPGTQPPLQEMNAIENQAFTRIKKALAAKSPGNYQFGGEPVTKDSVEVLFKELMCFNQPVVLQYLKKQIRTILSVKGIKGIALDYFGYQNYRCCRCSLCQSMSAKYQEEHPRLSRQAARESFALERLVWINNELAGYARTLNPQAKAICHVYPVFLPNILYGNRLNMDDCGQTVAWNRRPLWPQAKITSYTKTTIGQDKEFHPRAQGSAFIGYASAANAKDAARIRLEFQTAKNAGADRFQVYSMYDVLKNAGMASAIKESIKAGPHNRIERPRGNSRHQMRVGLSPLGEARIDYSLASREDVVLTIYDVRGCLIQCLNLGHRQPGNHQVVWDAGNMRGQNTAAGTYFVSAFIGGQRRTGRMVLAQ